MHKLIDFILGKKKIDLPDEQIEELKKIKQEAYMNVAKDIVKKKGESQARTDLANG